MTQIEREFVNRAIELCDIAGRGGLGKVNNNPLVQTVLLANRLLTERENPETVYKFSEKVPNMFSLGERQIIWGDIDGLNTRTVPVEEGIKGVWIADREAE